MTEQAEAARWRAGKSRVQENPGSRFAPGHQVTSGAFISGAVDGVNIRCPTGADGCR
jgi:hypothetical protein